MILQNVYCARTFLCSTLPKCTPLRILKLKPLRWKGLATVDGYIGSKIDSCGALDGKKFPLFATSFDNSCAKNKVDLRAPRQLGWAELLVANSKRPLEQQI